jgi:hypothetical protein
MPSRQDLLQAKQLLSVSLLKSGLRGEVIGMAQTHLVDRAIANTSQNVHAVGIGRKVVDGKPTAQLAVRVYVVQKLADSLIPPAYRIPTAVDGIPTDIIESAPAFISPARPRQRPRTLARTSSRPKRVIPTAANCTTARKKAHRPVIAGISAGHFKITAGTIAYFCRSTRPGDDPERIFVLSNNHVFANVNQGKAGDDLYQQGPADGGTSASHFAQLARWVDIKLGGTLANRVDAAIGSLLPNVAHKLEICTLGAITGIASAVEDTAVRKHGRTTGLTEGKVTDDSYDALVGMDHLNPNVVALFEGQMRIERVPPHPAIGLGGDSGSLVVRAADAAAVGLYFAGPSSGVYGVANHIGDVIKELEIQLL